MKVTIITAVFNGAQTLEKTIQSVLTQSYSNIQYIIADGNSVDNSVGIAKANADERCLIFSEDDLGLYDALNKSILIATGDIIGILNADDRYVDKDVISDVVNAFGNDVELDCLYGNLNYIRISGSKEKVVRRWISSHFSSQKLYLGWMPPHPTVFLRRHIYSKVGNFDLNYQISGDYDFLLRSFNSDNFKSKYLPRLMVNMQLGGLSNGSFKNITIKMVEDYRIIKKNKLRGIFTLALKNISKLKQLNGLRF